MLQQSAPHAAEYWRLLMGKPYLLLQPSCTLTHACYTAALLYRIPMSTCHPQIQAWAVSKPILVLLNRMDAISADDQKAWGHHFARQQQPVFWTNASEGTGVLKVRDSRLCISLFKLHALGAVLC